MPRIMRPQRNEYPGSVWSNYEQQTIGSVVEWTRSEVTEVDMPTSSKSPGAEPPSALPRTTCLSLFCSTLETDISRSIGWARLGRVREQQTFRRRQFYGSTITHITCFTNVSRKPPHPAPLQMP